MGREGLGFALVAGAGAALGALLLLRGARAATTPAAHVRVAQGRLLGPGNRTYMITQDDLLWMARCVVGEAGDTPTERAAGGIMWALAQNFMLVDRSPAFASLTECIRAYSHLLRTPTAEWCATRPQLCDATRAAIRRRLQGLSWEEVPPTVRGHVERWYRGQLPNPIPGLTDWASVPWVGGIVEIAGNIFGTPPGRRLVKAE